MPAGIEFVAPRCVVDLFCHAKALSSRSTLAALLMMVTPSRAAKWTPQQHEAAVAALYNCHSHVVDGSANFYWRVGRDIMPSLPADGCWYLHFGPTLLSDGLMNLVQKPDGSPAVAPPKSHQMLGTKELTEDAIPVVYKNMARNNLLAPRLWAMLPRRCKRHAYWEAPSILPIAPPTDCTGNGYPKSPDWGIPSGSA